MGRTPSISILLTEAEVAERLKVSRSFLRNMRSKPGRDPIPFIPVGRSIRYPLADLEQWLERRRVYDDLEASRLGA